MFFLGDEDDDDDNGDGDYNDDFRRRMEYNYNRNRKNNKSENTAAKKKKGSTSSGAPASAKSPKPAPSAAAGESKSRPSAIRGAGRNFNAGQESEERAARGPAPSAGWQTGMRNANQGEEEVAKTPAKPRLKDDKKKSYRLNPILDSPNEDLGASLWNRGKKTLDVEFKLTIDEGGNTPLICHSLIVGHWSSVLGAMIERARSSEKFNENGQVIVEINNVDFRRSDFEILIRYLYFRDVSLKSITPLRRQRLIRLARIYQIPGLERACKKFLRQRLSAHNVYLYLNEALEMEDEILKRRCLEIIRMNRGCFSPDIEFFDVNDPIMLEIVTLQQLPVNEMELFTFFYKWYEVTKDGDETSDSLLFINQNNNSKKENNDNLNNNNNKNNNNNNNNKRENTDNLNNNNIIKNNNITKRENNDNLNNNNINKNNNNSSGNNDDSDSDKDEAIGANDGNDNNYDDMVDILVTKIFS